MKIFYKVYNKLGYGFLGKVDEKAIMADAFKKSRNYFSGFICENLRPNKG